MRERERERYKENTNGARKGEQWNFKYAHLKKIKIN